MKALFVCVIVVGLGCLGNTFREMRIAEENANATRPFALCEVAVEKRNDGESFLLKPPPGERTCRAFPYMFQTEEAQIIFDKGGEFSVEHAVLFFDFDWSVENMKVVREMMDDQ